jgi:BMFP domain-containing protein YqiC
MTNRRVDAVLEQLISVVPNHLGVVKDELKNSFRPLLQEAFDGLGVVTREAFDAQVKVLHATRAKLDQLLTQINAMVEAESMSEIQAETKVGVGASAEARVDMALDAKTETVA